MNIGIDALTIDEKPTGIGWYGINFINSIDKVLNQSLNVTVYIQEKSKNFFKGVNNVNIKIIGNFKSNKQRIYYQQIKMSSVLKRDKIDFVHYIDYLVPVLHNEIPYIITIHDLSFYEKNFLILVRRYLKELLQKVLLKVQPR
ncbi:hypothetical protein [Thermoanaerobacter sp. YS13]|uniref:hypothetical protein n=1 Tax=Thermoanaerobacter sp. YS13 TaxID=1511746 RepID=UPI00068FAFE8|nr:hypothetical protein [Thermoanaerobacter sp. YS13]